MIICKNNFIFLLQQLLLCEQRYYVTLHYLDQVMNLILAILVLLLLLEIVLLNKFEYHVQCVGFVSQVITVL